MRATSSFGVLLLIGLCACGGEERAGTKRVAADPAAARGLPEPDAPGGQARVAVERPATAPLEKPALRRDMGDEFARPPSSASALGEGEPPIEVRSATLELTPGLVGGAGLRANIEYVVAAKPGAGALPPAARLITRVACPTAGETRADVLMKPLLGVGGGDGGSVAPRSAVAFFDEGLPARPHRCDLEFYYQPGVLEDEAAPLPEVFSHEGGGRATAGTAAGTWSKGQPVEVRGTTAGVARASGEGGGGERYLDLRVTLLRGEAEFAGRSIAVSARCELPDGSRITGEGGVFGELWALEAGDVVVKRAPVFFEDPPLSGAPRSCALRWRLETPLQPDVRAPLGVYCLRAPPEGERVRAEAGACASTPDAP